MKTLMQWLAIFCMVGCNIKEDLEKHSELYPNNRLRREYYLKKVPDGDPVRHGPYREYYPSGSNKETSTWKEGRLDGYVTAWYENGKTKWEKRYKGGLRTGTWRLNYRDGFPVFAMSFSKGLPEGNFQYWPHSDTSAVKLATYQAGNCVAGECDFFRMLQSDSAMPGEIMGSGRDSLVFREFFHSPPGQEPLIKADIPVSRPR